MAKEPACAIETTQSLARLMEQAVRNVPDVDALSYKSFRSKMSKLVPQLPDAPLDSSDSELMREILHEFAHYHKSAEHAVRDQIAGWRALVGKLLGDLLSKSGIDAASPDAAALAQGVATLLSGEELRGFQVQLTDFLRLQSVHGRHLKAAPAAVPSASNHNAAGLRDNAAAVEQVRNIQDLSGQGYVVLFFLSSLASIKERYGNEAMQDCLMAVSAFLTRNLRSDDNIYYWNENSLLAILQTSAAETVIKSAIQRIVDNNRDITLQIGTRVVMLRVPLVFEITPIAALQNAEELLEITARKKCKPIKEKALQLKAKGLALA